MANHDYGNFFARLMGQAVERLRQVEELEEFFWGLTEVVAGRGFRDITSHFCGP